MLCYLLGDNATQLAGCNEHFHAIVCDPPTGCGPRERGRADVQEWDKEWPMEHWSRVASACKKTLLSAGSVIVFPGSKQGPVSQSVAASATRAFTDKGFRLMTLYWDKGDYKGLQTLNPHKPFGDVETLLVFSLQTDTLYKEIGQTSSKIVAAQHSVHHADIHHFKPIELYDKLLAMFVPDGGRVCDITMYTGISAVACVRRSLHYVGIERNLNYIAMTKGRVQFEQFDSPPSTASVDADDCLPTGLGGSMLKRKVSGGARRAKKAAKQAEEEEGGHTDKGRIAFRDEGGFLITGGKRTCLPDAVCMLDSALDVDDMRTIMPDDPDEDTRFTAADDYLNRFDLTLSSYTMWAVLGHNRTHPIHAIQPVKPCANRRKSAVESKSPIFTLVTEIDLGWVTRTTSNFFVAPMSKRS